MTSAEEFDPYAVLGVPSDAKRSDIVRAFRRRALTEHPDRGGDAEVFRRVCRAYETLRDPARRAAYDRRPGPPAAAPGAGRRAAQEPPPAAADPFVWESGPGPGGDAHADRFGAHGAHSVLFPDHDAGFSWRRSDRFAWWRPVDEPPRRRRRRR